MAQALHTVNDTMQTPNVTTTTTASTLQLRRNGLIQRIMEGLPSCVIQEHKALYRLIRSKQPTAPYSINKNGVFIHLEHLRTDILEQCYSLIRHGLAQDEKERHRLHKQQLLRQKMT